MSRIAERFGIGRLGLYVVVVALVIAGAHSDLRAFVAGAIATALAARIDGLL